MLRVILTTISLIFFNLGKEIGGSRIAIECESIEANPVCAHKHYTIVITRQKKTQWHSWPRDVTKKCERLLFSRVVSGSRSRRNRSVPSVEFPPPAPRVRPSLPKARRDIRDRVARCFPPFGRRLARHRPEDQSRFRTIVKTNSELVFPFVVYSF